MLLVEIFLHITRSEKHVQWNRSSLSGMGARLVVQGRIQ